MSFNYERVIPTAIPMKRARDPKPGFNEINTSYLARLKEESNKTSQLFREKVAADRRRLGLS